MNIILYVQSIYIRNSLIRLMNTKITDVNYYIVEDHRNLSEISRRVEPDALIFETFDHKKLTTDIINELKVVNKDISFIGISGLPSYEIQYLYSERGFDLICNLPADLKILLKFLEELKKKNPQSLKNALSQTM